MASPQLDLLTTTSNHNNNNNLKGYDETRSGISFWAFLLSIVIYVFIFYIFNLSPSALVNTTKFWFFISNTLILIIAADFGAFTLSRKHQLYQHQTSRPKTAVNVTSLKLQLYDQQQIVERNISQPVVENPQEKLQGVDVIHERGDEENNEPEIVTKNDLEEINPGDSLEEEKLQEVPAEVENDLAKKPEIDEARHQRKEPSGGKFARSMSSGYEIQVVTDEKNVEVLQRSKSEKHEDDQVNNNAEENEFSTMSIEELNRRVEEFIQRSNRQIRLQGARHRQMAHAL